MFDQKATGSRLENTYPNNKSGKVFRAYRNLRLISSSVGYPIGQSADPGDLDGDVILHGERKVIRRNNASSREEYNAMRKTGFPAQPTDEVVQRSGHGA